MPSNQIVKLNFEYPAPGAYNLRELDKAIFNRYYSSYFARVESSGFPHPNDDLYLQNFNNTLPASFIHSDRVGLTLNPRKRLTMAHFRTFQRKTRFAARTVCGRGQQMRPTFRRKRARRTVQTYITTLL